MKASALKTRLHTPILLAILALGFGAPWQSHLDAGPRTAWVWLGVWLSTLGTSGDAGASPISSTSGIVLVTWAAIVFAAVGALLRVTAAARATKPRSGLLGAWLLVAAVSILMPPTGALAALTASALFLLLLALAPQPASPEVRVAETPARRWGRAILDELAPIAVFLSLAALSWQYNASLLERAMLIGCGLALIARAAAPSPQPQS